MRRVALALTLVVVACGAPDEPRDGGAPPEGPITIIGPPDAAAGADDAGLDDAGSPDAGLTPGDAGSSACLAVTCSGHGRCVEAGAAPACLCDEGYLPRDLGCEPMTRSQCVVPALPPATEVNLETGTTYSVPFRNTADPQPQLVDLAWPKAGTGHPVVLLIHGGGWRGGSRLDHRDDLLRLAGRGFVAAAIDYRLLSGGKNAFPAAISDARCAVRWLIDNASRYGGDASQVLVVGASAGANSAALLATSPLAAELDDGTCELQARGAPTVAGVVSYYGRMELSRAPVPDYVTELIGRTGNWQAREAASSPLRQVTQRTAPLLLVHGGADTTVPIEHSRLMRDAMARVGAPVALVELATQGHAFPVFEGAAGCSTLQFLTRFVRRPPLARATRTVVYVGKLTAPGEQLALRGSGPAPLRLRYRNTVNPDSQLEKASDGWLDWQSDSALDWTTDAWSPAFGAQRTLAADGYGLDPDNHSGPHFWKLDVDVDGAVGDWFEFKAVVRSSRATTWEPDVTQPGAPAVSPNHWGRVGYTTMVQFGLSGVTLQPLP